MRVQDALKLGFKPMAERKGRSALTILMVVVGIASIIALTSQTAGIQNSITTSLQALGPTTILVTPRAGAGATPLTQADVGQISTIPGVNAVIPVISVPVSITLNGQPTTVSVLGVSSSGLRTLLGNVNLVSGSLYPDSNVPLVLVGNSLAYPASGPAQYTGVGQPIVLTQQLGAATKTETVQISGILASSGSTPLIQADNSLFMPIEAASTLFNRQGYSMLLVQASSVNDVDSVANFLTQLYGSNAAVTTLKQIANTVSSIIGQISLLLGAIAGISLTVAGIGIMNIMLIAVYERTREIGILKAVGFNDRGVLLIFLSEAVLIGAVGAVVGIGLGAGVSFLFPILLSGSFRANAGSTSTRSGGGGFGGGGFGGGGAFGGGSTASLSYTPAITPEIVAISVVVAIVVSVVAGLYPALRAARMEPINALRHE